jgi:hypothetical protein
MVAAAQKHYYHQHNLAMNVLAEAQYWMAVKASAALT